MSRHLLVDADACPNTREIVALANQYHVPCFLYADTSHEIVNEQATVIVVGEESQSADLAISNALQAHDLLITSDYGLATIGILRKAICINPNGFCYTEDNIDSFLAMRHENAKARKRGHYQKIKKRTSEIEQQFLTLLETILKG